MSDSNHGISIHLLLHEEIDRDEAQQIAERLFIPAFEDESVIAGDWEVTDEG